jgi:predicted  nucleic acid-binding Zn-ribbon protein
MGVEPHEHDRYATTRDVDGVGSKVESMGERVAVNSERSKTNKQQITDLFELHRDTERQVNNATQAFERQVSKVTNSVTQIRTQIGVAVAVIIIVIEIGAKVLDKFF